MKNVLLDLWVGDLCPLSESTKSFDKTINVLASLDEHVKELEGLLDEEGNKLLKELNDAHAELQIIESEDAFIKGFSLAVNLIIEAVKG